MSGPSRPTAGQILIAMVEEIRKDNGPFDADARDYEQGLCQFCESKPGPGGLGENERAPHDAGCPWSQALAQLEEFRAQLGVLMMPVPRCDTCRWWKAHAPVRHMGDCALFETHQMDKVHRQAKLIVSRTESGEATIITYPDFGCVQWEEVGPRPATEGPGDAEVTTSASDRVRR